MITRRGFVGGSAASVLGLSSVGATSGLPAAVADVTSTRGDGIVDAIPALREPWSPTRSATILGANRPGPTWPKAEMFTFTTEVDPKTSAEWLPPPLVPTDPARAMLFLARYPMTKLGFGYNEAAVFLHGAYEDREYLHCTWMVVDDDTALILGRDLLGFPKKMAVMNVDIRGAVPTGAVERKGLPVFAISGSAPVPAESVQIFRYPVVNVVGGLSEAKLLQLGGGGSDAGAAENVHWAKAIDLDVELGRSALDPLHRLGMPSRHKGHVVVVDLGVGGTGDRAQPEGTLTGTPVPAAWLLKAYPFRVW